MAQTSTIKNKVPVLEMEEVVIGSQCKLAVQFEQLVSENPDVFEPIDFTGMVLKADIKDRPSKEVEPIAEFTCAIRDEPGWIDLVIDGDVTGALVEKSYEASLKIWPIGHPEQGDTLLVIMLPMKYKATR